MSVISFRGTADLLVPYEGGSVDAPNGVNGTVTFLGAAESMQRWAEINGCEGGLQH